MKPNFFLVAMAMMAGAAQGESRDFTQKDTGKIITGEIRGANSSTGTVTVALANGNVVNFKQDMLVEEDREFITAWAKENAFASNLRVSATKMTGERSTNKGTIYHVKKEQAGYRITLRNGSTSEKMENLTVNYDMVIEREGGKMETKSGSHTVALLAPGGSAEFNTETVALSVDMKSVSSCPKCISHASKFKGDDIEGIRVVVESNGKKGPETISPSSREKKILEVLAGNPKG